MALLTIFKERALPAQLEANAMYLIAPPGKPHYIEMYVSGMSGSTIKRIPTTEDIQLMINASTGAIPPGAKLEVVADIAARDALLPVDNMMVMVVDATADPTVDTGAATYVYQATNLNWHKISENESMDLVLDWANIQNKPMSSVLDIDDAVNKRHSHANLAQLNKIGEDVEGNLLYNGLHPKAGLQSENW